MSDVQRGAFVLAAFVLLVSLIAATWMVDGWTVAGRVALTGVLSCVALLGIGGLLDGMEDS